MPKLSEILGEHFKQIPEDIQKKYKDIDLVDSSNYIEKKELDTANETIKQYKKDIAKRDKDLVDLQGKIKDNEELNAEIENLKAANKKASEDYESKLNQITFETKLEKKLGEFKPKNLGILKKALDIEKISLDGDNFLGLEDQIKNLKESDPYLFAEETPGGTGNIGGGQSSIIDDNKDSKSIGEVLGKQQADQFKINETIDSFFK
ncbi:capsid scaffolding protein (endogenous virus) [Clostridium phage phiCTC2A]|nr:phage scaffolding protein [Clostridium tetani]YP_009277244.1 head scaffolding protein [Clostridium phage phiCTC2A]YP_009277311.1 head scaffolding protein [Clostridium phage phiCT19406A]AJA42727.1 capsid scaffolding protein [Clostridium phage phiCT19406A]AJA42923.1 capsid scaffolding protein [Clostridium phage phiCTC2A]KGI38439.1 phage scaffold protein [Clostridium tetani]KGI42887.1 phage scaffold protein [Clostridium tetani]KHO33631.1 phage scaffold protein [Clostridium tetani]